MESTAKERGFSDKRLNMKPVVVLERLPAECLTSSTWQRQLHREHLPHYPPPLNYIPVPMSLPFYKRQQQEGSRSSKKHSTNRKDSHKRKSSRSEKSRKKSRANRGDISRKKEKAQSYRSIVDLGQHVGVAERNGVLSPSSPGSLQTVGGGGQQSNSGSDTEIDESAAYDTCGSHDSDATVMLPMLSEMLADADTDTDMEERDLTECVKSVATAATESAYLNSLSAAAEGRISAEDEIDAFTSDVIQSVLDVHMSSLPDFVERYFAQLETCLAVLSSMEKCDRQVYVEVLDKKRDSLKRIFELFRGLLQHVSFCHVDRLSELERELCSFLGIIVGVDEPNSRHFNRSSSARAADTAPCQFERGGPEGANMAQSPSAGVMGTPETLNAAKLYAVYHHKEPSETSSAVNCTSQSRLQGTVTISQVHKQTGQPAVHQASSLKVESIPLDSVSESGRIVNNGQQPLPVAKLGSHFETAAMPLHKQLFQHHLQGQIQRQAGNNIGTLVSAPNSSAVTNVGPLSQGSATAQSLAASIRSAYKKAVSPLSSGSPPVNILPARNNNALRPIVSKVQLPSPNAPLASSSITLVVKGTNSSSQAAHRIIFGNAPSSPGAANFVSRAPAVQLQGQTTASPRTTLSQMGVVGGAFPPVASSPSIPLTVQRQQMPFPLQAFGVQSRVPVMLNSAQGGSAPQVRWAQQGLLLVPGRPANCSTGFLSPSGSSLPMGQSYIQNGWPRSNVALVLPPPCTVNQQVRSSVISIQAPLTVLPAANTFVHPVANDKPFGPVGNVSQLQNRTAAANSPTQNLWPQHSAGTRVQRPTNPTPGCITGVVVPTVRTVPDCHAIASAAGPNAAVNNVLRDTDSSTVSVPTGNSEGTKAIHSYSPLPPHLATGHSR